MQVSLSERFPALSPLSLRREKAREVFKLMVSYGNLAKSPEYKKRHDIGSAGKKGKPKVIRKPAGDNWF